MVEAKQEKRGMAPLERAVAVIVVIVLIGVALHTANRYLPTSQFQNLQIGAYTIDLLDVLIVIIGTFAIYRVCVSAIESAIADKTDQNARNKVRTIIRIVFYIVVIAIILAIFGVSITGILAGSTVGGIILGLAVQTVMTNIISGSSAAVGKSGKARKSEAGIVPGAHCGS